MEARNYCIGANVASAAENDPKRNGPPDADRQVCHTSSSSSAIGRNLEATRTWSESSPMPSWEGGR